MAHNFRLAPPGWAESDWPTDESDFPEDVIAAFFQDSPPPTTAPPTNKRRFAAPVTSNDVQQAEEAAVPKSTRNDTKWCMKLWDLWSSQRPSCSTEAAIPTITALNNDQLQHWLCRFILEVRKENGQHYPPATLHHIVSGIMRFLRQSGRQLDLFQDPAFQEFRTVLDSEMKHLKAAGLGSKTRKAEPLTEEEEELLWEKGILGDHTPQALLNTVFFHNGIYFALRSGNEHRQLRHRASKCQITIVERPGQRPFLQYVEDISKNNPGGLKGRKINPKTVIQHDNPGNPARCAVSVFRKYQQLCPENCPKGTFYLQPLQKPKPNCWFSIKPLGYHTLDNMVRDMCRQAGIPGYKTNHSLRVTAATRLYRHGVDEQLIMERTGHRSLDGVRSYKRTSADQQEALSDILAMVPAAKRPTAQTATQPTPVPAVTSQSVGYSSQMIGEAPGVTIQNCSNITINFNCKL